MAVLASLCCLLLLLPASAELEAADANGLRRAGTCGIAASDPQYEAYAADPTKQVPGWEEVNLDLPPKQRWAHLVAPAAKEIAAMLEAFKATTPRLVHAFLDVAERAFEGRSEKLIAALPQPYGDEIAGIEAATGIPASDLLIYNIMYELSGACTSIVASDGKQLLHGRNLDFGDGTALSAKLRPLLQQIRFVKGGKTVFNSTSYLGYVGCLTCMKTGGFSITVDTRMWTAEHGLPVGLLEWMLGTDRSGSFLAFLTRDAMERDANYDQAVQRVNATRLLGPAYVILGGAKPREGAVVTRSEKESLHFWSLEASAKPYLLETNYDHWVKPGDHRRGAGNACMDELPQLSFKSLFQVLSAEPTRNSGTTYTSLISTQTGRFESYIQGEARSTGVAAGAEVLV